LIDFDLAPPSSEQPLIRLIQSTNVTLSGYQSTTPVARFLRVEGEASSDIKLTGNDFTRVKEIAQLAEGCVDAAVKEVDNLK
jgi:hypothetical protein